jgi:nucleoside-diphosphate-sugar epimerase
LKVLFIGGSGVISADSVLQSHQAGHDVYVLNRGIRAQADNGVCNIIADIRNASDVINKVEDHFFDVVVDFLSYTPEQLKSTLDIFQPRCSQFIFISSATVYSNSAKGGLLKETSPLGSEWDYAANKLKCENLLADYYRTRAGEYTIVRPYVTYSDIRIPYAIIPDHQRSWSLIHRIMSRKPVLIWDEGVNHANIIHSADFARYFVGLFGNTKSYGEAFHITSDEVVVWRDVLDELSQSLGLPVDTISLSARQIAEEWPQFKDILLSDKATDMVFDNSKIKAAVPGVVCSFDLHKGIERVVRFYEESPVYRRVDFAWDSMMDNLVSRHVKKEGQKRLRYVPFAGWKFKEWIQYIKVRDCFVINLLKMIRDMVRR